MGKMPAFQFYPGDWKRDTQVQMASMETRGVWIEMICCMWDAPDRGKLTGDRQLLSRLLGCEVSVLNRSLIEIERLKIADVTNGHNEVTIVNRRMSREQKGRDDARLRKQRQRKASTSHKKVTSPSSSSTSSSPSKNKKGVVKIELPEWLSKKTWGDFLAHRKQLKSPMTDEAQKRMIKKLENLKDDGHDPEQILDQSMVNGWKGIFSIKQEYSEKSEREKFLNG